jgi:hypothetical protein
MFPMTVCIADKPAAGRRLEKPFNRGLDTLHQSEIQLGREMAIAAYLLYGKQRCDKAIETAPSSLFRSFRYGRCITPPKDEFDRGRLDIALHHGPLLGKNRAKDCHIMQPGGPDWIAFLEQVQRVAHRPRYAEGWSATAEVLDDMGYAIAESITVLELLNYKADEDLIYILLKFRDSSY